MLHTCKSRVCSRVTLARARAQCSCERVLENISKSLRTKSIYNKLPTLKFPLFKFMYLDSYTSLYITMI